MARAPRLEYPGALYHVTVRGVRQDDIFCDDRDRTAFLATLTWALQKFDAHAFALCLMGNHFHVVLQTRQANLSRLMQRLNTLYSQGFNRRHGRCGHLLEGRFKALHVDRDAYFLEVCRYVDLNPVRAGWVDSPGQWRWSSYRAHIGATPSPSWLATTELHAALLGNWPRDAVQIALAQGRYAEWVDAGRGAQLWKESLRQGLFLGDQAFVDRVLAHVK
jgi:REP element-mobilizing transposase RayT